MASDESFMVGNCQNKQVKLRNRNRRVVQYHLRWPNLFIAGTFFVTTFGIGIDPQVALADLDASNAHNDRAYFEKCSDAIDSMLESNDKLIVAAKACNKSMIHYAQEVDTAKDKNSRCIALLYTGSTTKLFAYVLSQTMNQRGSKKLTAMAGRIFDEVGTNCDDEPNIQRAAKSMRAFKPT